VTQTYYGGPVEYIVAALLVLQIPFARVFLRRGRNWPGVIWVITTVLASALWFVSLTAFWLTWSGNNYGSNFWPTGLRAGIVAVGYFWLFLSTFAAGVAFVLRFLMVRYSGLHSPSRRRWIQSVGVLAVSAPVASAAFGAFIGRNEYRIRELDFPVPGLHPDLEGFRITQVSDLHVSPFLSVREAARVIDMANELHGDLAVFTGDLISELGDPLDPAIRELIRLKADQGVYGCMGNHEEYVGCRNYLESRARQAGLIFLRGRTTQIHRGQATLNIAGVDYERYTKRSGYLPGAERLVMPGVTNLLLSHNPDVFPTAIQRGFQAVLGGHTHGGQVNVEILHRNFNPARFHTPFTSGLYRQGGSGKAPGSCFVTNGIGTIGVPVRLGAPPEIALLRLRRA
jgi:predicted MPP superfamily phosphohydrolase